MVTDPSNCGKCGAVCGGGTTCVNGACSCPTKGDVLCGQVCVNTSTDPSNCGTCGAVCPAGQTCGGGHCTCASSTVSLSAQVQPILSASCAINGCHTGAAPQQGMNLSTGMTYANTVNVAAAECSGGRLRVKPGDAANSYIVQKLTNVDLCSGTQMPKTGGPLSSADIQTLSSWICEGAPNN